MSGVRGNIDAQNLYTALQLNSPQRLRKASSVPLDATAGSVDNLNTITTEYRQFQANVSANDTVVFYFHSHGGPLLKYGLNIVELGISVDYIDGNSQIDAADIANLLNLLANSTRKVVILDACHTGDIANYLAHNVPNISVLSASSAYQETVGEILSTAGLLLPRLTGQESLQTRLSLSFIAGFLTSIK